MINETLQEKIDKARMSGDKMSYRLYSCLQLAAETVGASEQAMLDMFLNDWLDEREIIIEFQYDIDWPEEFGEEEEE